MKFNRFLSTFGVLAGMCMTAASADAIVASVKTTGMAATGIAYPQDALAAVFNPAGPTEIGDRIDAGLSWGHDEGRTKIRGNPVPGVNGTYYGYKTKDFYSPDFGINKRYGCECEWAFGLVVYNRNQSKTTYRRPFSLLGTSNPGLEYVHETISPYAAYRINECHSVGLSVNWMIQRLKVNGIENFDNPLFSANPGHVTNRGYNYSQGCGVTLGWQWRITDELTFGLTYQPKTHMRRFKKYDGFLADNGRFDIPEKIGGGIAWRFLPCATIAFDMEWIEWKPIKALSNRLLNGTVLEDLGSRNGPGFGWKNQLYYRVGIDYALNEDWTVRAGFRHVDAPIRTSQTVVNQLSLDTVEDFLTLGATYAYSQCTELSIYGAWGFRHRIKGNGSIPPAFGGGESNIEQQKAAIGLSVGVYY